MSMECYCVARSVAKCRGSWVVGRGRGSWVWVNSWVKKKKFSKKKKCKIHETKIPEYIQVLFPFPAVSKANSINGH